MVLVRSLLVRSGSKNPHFVYLRTSVDATFECKHNKLALQGTYSFDKIAFEARRVNNTTPRPMMTMLML